MGFKKRNPSRNFDRGEKQNQIEMVMFLNRQFVVQAKRKIAGVMHYDLIAAIGSDIQGQRFVGVTHEQLVRLRHASDDTYFDELRA